MYVYICICVSICIGLTRLTSLRGTCEAWKGKKRLYYAAGGHQAHTRATPPFLSRVNPTTPRGVACLLGLTRRALPACSCVYAPRARAEITMLVSAVESVVRRLWLGGGKGRSGPDERSFCLYVNTILHKREHAVEVYCGCNAVGGHQVRPGHL